MIQEAQRTLIRIKNKQKPPRHIVVELLKIKDKRQTLKATKERKKKKNAGIPLTKRFLNTHEENTLSVNRVRQ